MGEGGRCLRLTGRLGAPLGCGALLTGCGRQSILSTASKQAHDIALLWWWMLGAAVVVFLDLGWLIGALRLMPSFDVTVGHYTLIPNPFWGGVLFPLGVVAVLMAFPWVPAVLFVVTRRVCRDLAGGDLVDAVREQAEHESRSLAASRAASRAGAGIGTGPQAAGGAGAGPDAAAAASMQERAQRR